MEKKNYYLPTTLAGISEKISEVIEDSDNEVGDTHSSDDAIRPLLATNCSEYVVAHSNVAMYPVRQFSEVFLLPHILETMRKMGISRLRRLQSYTWPHLIAGSGHGAMIVSARRSGRTLGYIPPLCDLVFRAVTIDIRMRGPANWYNGPEGPLAVILVPDLKRVLQVSALCSALLRKAPNEESFTLTMTTTAPMMPEVYHRLLNGVGCLVVTPGQMVALTQEAPGLLRFPRLQFVVFDDMDQMPPDQVQMAENALLKLLPRDRYPQTVIVSTSYDRKLLAKLTAANSKVALVFGDILEAAVYGGTRIKITLSPSEVKVAEVLKALQHRPPKDYHTIVYCSDDEEMRRLVVALKVHGHACLPYYQNADLEVLERVHRWLAKTRGVILLCTDNCPELTIRTAHTLIHYGMSRSWSRFKMRHLAISENIINRLTPTEASPEKMPLHSLVLLDDQNQMQLPRFVDFLQKHQRVDSSVLRLVKKIRQEIEKESGNHNVLCRQIMAKGVCIANACNERHHLTVADRCPASVPASGDVKVKLVRVYSPTHFCVYLLEHRPPQGSWQPLQDPPTQHMRIQLLQNAKPRRYWPPVAGDICLYHNSINERVRVLQVVPIKIVNLVNVNLDVLVQAIDVDTRIFTAKSGRLYECPEKMQQMPPMAIDLRLLGLVSFSGECDWTEEYCRAVEYKLANLSKEHFLQVHIEFASANTLFARNLVAMTYASSLKMHMQHLSLSHVLIVDKTLKKCAETEKKILDFFLAGEEVENVKQEIKEMELQELELEDQIEEELHVKQEEDQKENVSPNKAILLPSSGRGKILGMYAFEEIIEDQVEQKQSHHEAATSLIAQEPPQAPSNRDSFAQFYDCFMRCSLLDLEEKQQSEKDLGSVSSSTSNFLDILASGGASGIPSKPKGKKAKRKAIKAAPKQKDSSQQPQLQLPANVVRPTTSYYQTHSTLELHVVLPDDVFYYAVLLEKSQILFWASCKLSELKYQFELVMSFPYSSLSHRLQGRTVYISVHKAVAAADPLDFSVYPFMKPNYEMCATFGEQEMLKLNAVIKRQNERIAVQPRVQSEEDEESNDEDRTSDREERPEEHKKIYED